MTANATTKRKKKKTMSKFEVTFEERIIHTVIVEAEDQEQAETIAFDTVTEGAEIAQGIWPDNTITYDQESEGCSLDAVFEL